MNDKLRDVIADLASERVEDKVIVTKFLAIAETVEADGWRRSHIFVPDDTTCADDLGMAHMLTLYCEDQARDRVNRDTED